MAPSQSSSSPLSSPAVLGETSTIVNETIPATFDARVRWAIKSRAICRLPEHDKVGVLARPILDFDGDREIAMFQELYEENYHKKRAKMEREREERERQERERQERERQERERQERERKEREEQEREREERTKKKREHEIAQENLVRLPREHPGMAPKPKLHQMAESVMPTSSKRPAPTPTDEDEDDDEQETARPRHMNKKFKGDCGPRNAKPCKACVQYKSACHEQNPRQTSCYECRKRHVHCSFVQKPKAPRGSNRTKEMIKSEGESEREGSSQPRHSLRIVDDEFLQQLDNLVQAVEDLTEYTRRQGDEIIQQLILMNKEQEMAVIHNRTIADEIRRQNGQPQLGPVKLRDIRKPLSSDIY